MYHKSALMKKNHYFVFVFILFAAILSCRKEFSDSTEPNLTSFTVQNAKDYLQSELKINSENIILKNPNAISKLNLSMGSDARQQVQATGLVHWNGAKVYEMEMYDVVEAPFLSQNNFISLYSFGLGDNFLPIDRQTQRAAQSYTSILIYESTQNNVKDLAFVTYIPDLEYLELYNFEIENSRLNNVQMNKFSGYLEYKNFDQEVLFVLRLDDGEVIKRHHIIANNNRLNHSKMSLTASETGEEGLYQHTNSSCQTVCTPIYQTICVDPPEGMGGEPICVTQQIGENCHEVCDGGGGPGDPPNPGGGGETNNPNSVTLTETKALINNVFERCPSMADGTEHYNIFENSMLELMNRAHVGCYAQYMFTYLSNPDGSKIILCMDNSIAGAHYNAANKSMKFSSELYLDQFTILHETIHAVQDKVYPGGSGQYGYSAGKADIEFETFLFIDMLRRFEGYAPDAFRPDSANLYRSFLNGLIEDNLNSAKMYFNNPTVNTAPEYVNYFNLFRAYRTGYGDGIGLNPMVITHLLNMSPCVDP